jgi:branched-chain amino acid transport system substrate-binding protein
MTLAVPATPAAEPFTIYGILSLTGIGAFSGHASAGAIHLYETVVNKSGGIGGRPVHFELLDDQSNPRVAVQLANDVLAKHAPIILGPTSQATCNAVGAVAATTAVVYCLSPGIDPPKGGFMFSAGLGASKTLPINLRYFRATGHKRVASLMSNDATGQHTEDLLDAAIAEPENRSLTMVLRERFENSALSVDAQMSRIKAASPDFIYAVASGTPFQTILRSYRDLGMKTPVVTSVANMYLNFLTPYIGGLPDPLLFNGPLYWGMDPKEAGAFAPVLNEYLSAHRDAGTPPSPDEGFGWDSSRIIVSAFRKLGTSPTGDGIRRYMLGLQRFYGISGKYDFRNDQHGLGYDAGIILRFDSAHSTFVPASGPGGVPLK